MYMYMQGNSYIFLATFLVKINGNIVVHTYAYWNPNVGVLLKEEVSLIRMCVDKLIP